MRVFRTLSLAAVLLALAALAAALATGRVALPNRWNPFAPLAVAEPPNFLTRHKLARLSRDPAACLAALDGAAGLPHSALPDHDAGNGCGWHDAVRLGGAPGLLAPAVPLSCPAAVSLALWERHAVQPLALRHFGQRVVRVEHLGSYACRNVDGGPPGRRSRHATADAIDVSGVVLASGRRVRVASWSAGGADARFLRELHDGACPFFDAVLGPAYNAAHRDHFHLDRGSHGISG